MNKGAKSFYKRKPISKQKLLNSEYVALLIVDFRHVKQMCQPANISCKVWNVQWFKMYKISFGKQSCQVKWS